MLYYVHFVSDAGAKIIKGPYSNLKIAKHVAFHFFPFPGHFHVFILDRFDNVITHHYQEFVEVT